jgi:small subunit ribosomal protein S16
VVGLSVKIRLTRVGRRNRAYYRLVVADSRKPRDGRFIEIIGTYQPLSEGKNFTVNEEKALEWLQRGAIPSDTVRSLFRKLGIMKRFHELRHEKKLPAASQAQ